MQAFADSKRITPDEAWRTDDWDICATSNSLGYTPATFTEEFGESDRPPPGAVQAMVESSKKSKPDATSRMVKKCANAIYSVTL